MAKRKWRELPPALRTAIIAAAAVQIALVGAAHADMSRRPAEQIRGPKGLWRLATLVNFVGPVAYFRWGRLAPGTRP
ncbi:MAG TPA: hypothetical protein VFQ96_01925 [Microbacteriaceae bacterium]|nr:hypothetical protein [Microbacteriaceae bacterium]